MSINRQGEQRLKIVDRNQNVLKQNYYIIKANIKNQVKDNRKSLDKNLVKE